MKVNTDNVNREAILGAASTSTEFDREMYALQEDFEENVDLLISKTMAEFTTDKMVNFFAHRTIEAHLFSLHDPFAILFDFEAFSDEDGEPVTMQVNYLEEAWARVNRCHSDGEAQMLEKMAYEYRKLARAAEATVKEYPKTKPDPMNVR